MNVYDFDETVFQPDSSACFIRFCLRHYPRAVSRALPRALLPFLIYLKNGKQDAKPLKEALFSFLNRIDNIDRVVEEFWRAHESGIEEWYLKQKRPDDLIISASPEFLLKPIAEKLGVSLIATPMNPYTGKIQGKNCHDQEKVRRFLEQYSADSIEEFYSDSFSDSPMASLAQQAFFVKGNEYMPWPEEEK